ncbi:hypothetical protein JCM21714_2131 [Gracilibacillus boraciitolerans JCM 21714]|uniref:PD-(D/E)XK endonuclease-like domain-containing protein n=1 Tax=Gracilibacillus boraciitolerans JCM 21714 TaxID=1298598 RepID=W4VK00_9BACI|nr:PD-(D/E)XK nuclease family protein [Gracilibacillus boraciitolerans]GAE93094.1 hypothetical protein JCM21714_2131 [Gracilibacillus boraciitolerans JCM 21714]
MKEFSFSRLSLYETCPQRFYYKYVLGMEEPITKPLALGKAVHKAIECLLNGETFQEAIKKAMIEADFHEEVTAIEVEELVLKAPLVHLKGGETEIYFSVPLFPTEKDSPVIRGYIDLIDGNQIYDFKTNFKAYEVTDNFQVGLYAWAMEKERKLKGKIRGSLLFLRHKRESKYYFDEEAREHAVRWARSLVKEIQFKLEMVDFSPSKRKELFSYRASAYCEHCPFTLKCYKDNPVKHI